MFKYLTTEIKRYSLYCGLGIIICSVISIKICLGVDKNAGRTGADFLKIGVAARPSGMGEAYIGLAEDVYALHWNPAGLANIKKDEFFTTYSRWFEKTNYGFIGYAHSLKKNKAIGLSIVLLNSGGIEKTIIDETSTLGYREDGSFSIQDVAYSIGYAQRVPVDLLWSIIPLNLEELDVGGVLKIIQCRLDKVAAHAFAMDLGLKYRLPFDNLPPSDAGLVIQNIGSSTKFDQENDPLLFITKLGINSNVWQGLFHSVHVGLDLNFPQNSGLKTNMGVEYWYNDMFAARIGYKGNYDTEGLTAGLGLKYEGYQIDYSYGLNQILGDIHRISLGYRFK